jgi:hypothetical protein
VSTKYGAIGFNILVQLDDGPITRPMRARVESIGEEVRTPLYIDDYVYVDVSQPVWVDPDGHIVAVSEHDLFAQELGADVIRAEDLVDDDSSIIEIDTTEARRDIFEEIDDERQYQDEVIGGPVNDDQQREADWVRYIQDYATGTGISDKPEKGPRSFRERMVKVAALAVAAVESRDRLDEKAWVGEN